jgi:hypothetical protein
MIGAWNDYIKEIKMIMKLCFLRSSSHFIYLANEALAWRYKQEEAM